MAEITMQELMEKATQGTQEAIVMTNDEYGVALTTDVSRGIMWYFLYVRAGIPGAYNIVFVRTYHVRSRAVDAFKALTV